MPPNNPPTSTNGATRSSGHHQAISQSLSEGVFLMSSQIQGQLPTPAGLSALGWPLFWKTPEYAGLAILLIKTTSAESLLAGTRGQSQGTGLTEHSQGKRTRFSPRAVGCPDLEACTDCPLTPHLSLVLLHTYKNPQSFSPTD